MEDARRIQTPIDAFIQAALERRGLGLAPPADPAVLRRRLSYDLLGLPPDPKDVLQGNPAATRLAVHVSRWLDELLASPHYGERWGKYWLDAVGYADSNGYFSADTDRPWAYRYRDYVVRAFQRDLPFDQFVREQLAGDELVGYVAGQPVSPAQRELLLATHFLRNAQDGTSESDGNPDERTVDRATVLEGTVQIAVNSLLGLTIQCARCHDHKFEPISQRDYYALQAVFYPAFPALHPDHWVPPVQRVQDLASEEETAEWAAAEAFIDRRITDRRHVFSAWVRANRPRGRTVFEDAFQSGLDRWSATAPGDDRPAGLTAVELGGSQGPAARIEQETLHIDARGETEGDRWLCTQQIVDWTPDEVGDWVQATFDLVDNRLGPEGQPAERIAFLIAAHDFDDSSTTQGGNLLIDGNSEGGASLHLDYPGQDALGIGKLGTRPYKSGHSFGVRVTNLGEGKYQLDQLVDWQVDPPGLDLNAAQLPNGALAFEYCCGRSFVVDNVSIEHGTTSTADTAFPGAFAKALEVLTRDVQQLHWQRTPKPGPVALVTDAMLPPPPVHVLERGSYRDPGPAVEPGGLAVLTRPTQSSSTAGADGANGGLAPFRIPENTEPESAAVAPSRNAGDAKPGPSGRRLALARWLTDPDSPAAALLARVMVNRIWQYHFGRGLVAPEDNFGVSGQPPSHPELLEYLAAEFIRSGWSVRAMHRLIVSSAVYQQSGILASDSAASRTAADRDPGNLLLWHYPLRRLDAEAVRDAMLALGGDLDSRMFGPYTPATRADDGNVSVDEAHPGARRRSLYLYQRRTQVDTLLQLFDAPAMAATCARRSHSTVPLQSLALLNSRFVRQQAERFAARVLAAAGTDDDRIRFAFLCVANRDAEPLERAACQQFLERVAAESPPDSRQLQACWTDLCQMLLASNALLYVE